MNELGKLPYLGVGVGHRDEIVGDIWKHKKEIQVLEVIAERYLYPKTREELEPFRAEFPIIPHGVDLSVGSAEELDMKHLEKVKELTHFLNAPYFSDHFALTKLGDYSLGHLSPIWFTKESLQLVIDRVKKTQDHLEIPLVLENITSMFEIPGAEFSEMEFISAVSDKTGCGLHLDVTNVFINAYNNKSDPYDYLKNFPLDRVIQMHLAGGYIHSGWLYDSHSEEISGVNEGVWPIFEWAIERAQNLKSVIIERDENFKDFETMFGSDIRRARGIVEKYRKTR